MSVLETKDIVKRYKNRTVVDGISLKVETGTVVGLLGPNGAGKTTTFYTIAGFVRPDAGVILLDGEDITGLPIHQRAVKGLSYLPQESSVFKKLTVEENVRIVLEPLGLAKAEINNRVGQLMEDLKISHL
ncbi:MAG: ATP-binding cassette domain-containing protein, partial [Desulfurivibrionaceae bacterium]